mgnify:FL=1
MMFVVALPLASAQLLYEVEVLYKDGEITVSESDVMYSRTLKANPYFLDDDKVPAYKVELHDKDGNIIYSELFSPPVYGVIHTGENETITGSEYLFKDEFRFTIYLPYVEETHSLQFYNEADGSLVALSDVSTFAQDEARKQKKESFVPPTQDVENAQPSDNPLFYMLLFVVALLIIAFVLFVVFRRKR